MGMATSAGVTTSTATTSAAAIAAAAPCDNNCTFDGLTSTCGARIRWSSLHVNQGESDPCQASRELVVSHCSAECAKCTLKSAMCAEAAEVERLPTLKRYEEPRSIDSDRQTVPARLSSVYSTVVLSAIVLT